MGKKDENGKSSGLSRPEPERVCEAEVRVPHHPPHLFISASGGIGRHAALRWLCRKAWRFKSSLSHHGFDELTIWQAPLGLCIPNAIIKKLNRKFTSEI